LINLSFATFLAYDEIPESNFNQTAERCKSFLFLFLIYKNGDAFKRQSDLAAEIVFGLKVKDRLLEAGLFRLTDSVYIYTSKR